MDHVIPFADGGPTTASNIAPKCRGHRRYMTSRRVSYRTRHPGTYHWTTPNGSYLVDPTGTYPLTANPPEK
jgi:hypothetical protein